MFYKLCNTSSLYDVESELNTKFRYPKLYEQKAIINGKYESNLPVITSEAPNTIDFAIWGLLPPGYDGDWEDFQEITNTLNTSANDNLLNEEIYADSLDTRRCLIVVNGFFTAKLHKGRLYPHHVHLKQHKPFCIAGVYNKIDDGFLTCTLLVTNSVVGSKHLPNMGIQKPLIFKKKDYNSWLDRSHTFKELKPIIDDHDRYEFIAHPIEQDFYKNPKVFKQIIESQHYKSVLRIAH
ncbi:SOS response-associated peptidase [Psychroserpens sp. SPM9]|uniref:SOS response-associated peptidase n=1 Tax=Psychroserpens sp. SPM9 TaxID=2975598 RepID=UPI0021A7F725|nr:SOS response-associated peptidase [Psychroserpens sp. SPM9]MDG5492935.1 SOS response-associated peptidase [Psychroserpens sp. SPM9]